MKRSSAIALASALLVFTMTACSPAGTSTEQNPTGQSSSGQPANQTSTTTKPETPEPVKETSLVNELTINKSIVIGKTTLADISKTLGQPTKTYEELTGFRKGISTGGDNLPQIPELVAFFKVNPYSGKPIESEYPLFFTTGQNNLLVSATVPLVRGKLQEKQKKGTATFEDVKKEFGEPTRQTDQIMEYYDFPNRIMMIVKKFDGDIIGAQITKYDLLYEGDQADLEAHENIIKQLSKEEKGK